MTDDQINRKLAEWMFAIPLERPSCLSESRWNIMKHYGEEFEPLHNSADAEAIERRLEARGAVAHD